MNEIEKLIKRRHLKNFVKKGVAPSNKLEERRESAMEKVAQPVNDRSSGTINMIIREEAMQPLRLNKKRRRDYRQKETEVI